MKLSVKLVENDSQIRTNILSSLKDVVDRAMKKTLPNIKNKIKEIVKNAIISQPEYLSLISGSLRYELGIASATQVQNIIDIWVNNISINYSGVKITNSGLISSLSLDMIKSSYDDVLASTDAIVIDSMSGLNLPWLEWLLLYGGKIIVRDYRVQVGPNSRSRTGMAVMVQSKGSNWRVPPEFAGTAQNNWITRAIDSLDDKIFEILKNELMSNI